MVAAGRRVISSAAAVLVMVGGGLASGNILVTAVTVHQHIKPPPKVRQSP
jgi:hypothetical protein